MKPTFTPSELAYNAPSNSELIRTQNVFQTLKEKIENKEYISELEVNFVAMLLNLPSYKGIWIRGFDEVNTYKFKMLFLVYFSDFSGKEEKRKYIKVKPHSIIKYNPDKTEIETDLGYLNKLAFLWEQTILIPQTDSLLKEVAEETQAQLRFLSNSPENKNDPFHKTRTHYKKQKLSLILNTKYVYHVVSEIFESKSRADLKVTLNSEELEITFYSLVHILIRHYAKEMKKWNTGKSHHNKDFAPRDIIEQVKTVFRKIEDSKYLIGNTVNKILFNYNGNDYAIYLRKIVENVIGKPNNIYRRIETFFPIEDEKITKELTDLYTIKIIDSKLSVYVPQLPRVLA